MSDPWRTSALCQLASIIVSAHRRHTGRDLVAADADALALADALYATPQVVLAHDGASDPRYLYANRAAQALWGYSWAEFIGMPSRLSAPPEGRQRRDGLLATARATGVIHAPDQVRVTRTGRLFRIAEVVLWNLDGVPGQAATFDRWSFLDA